MLTGDVTPLMEVDGRYGTDTLPVTEKRHVTTVNNSRAKRLKPSDEMCVAPSKSSGSSHAGANVHINPPVDPWADICPCLMKSNDVGQTSLEDQVDPVTSVTAENLVEGNRTEIQRWQVPRLCTPEC